MQCDIRRCQNTRCTIRDPTTAGSCLVAVQRAGRHAERILVVDCAALPAGCSVHRIARGTNGHFSRMVVKRPSTAAGSIRIESTGVDLGRSVAVVNGPPVDRSVVVKVAVDHLQASIFDIEGTAIVVGVVVVESAADHQDRASTIKGAAVHSCCIHRISRRNHRHVARREVDCSPTGAGAVGVPGAVCDLSCVRVVVQRAAIAARGRVAVQKAAGNHQSIAFDVNPTAIPGTSRIGENLALYNRQNVVGIESPPMIGVVLVDFALGRDRDHTPARLIDTPTVVGGRIVMDVAVNDQQMMSVVCNTAAVAVSIIAVHLRILESGNPIRFIAAAVFEVNAAPPAGGVVAVHLAVHDGCRPVRIETATAAKGSIAVDGALREGKNTVGIKATSPISVGAGHIVVDLAVAHLQPTASIEERFVKVNAAAIVAAYIIVVNRTVGDLHLRTLDVDAAAIAAAVHLCVAVDLAAGNDSRQSRTVKIKGTTVIRIIIDIFIQLAVRQIQTAGRIPKIDRIAIVALIVVEKAVGDRNCTSVGPNCAPSSIGVKLAVLHGQRGILVVDSPANIVVQKAVVGDRQLTCIVDASTAKLSGVVAQDAVPYIPTSPIFNTFAQLAQHKSPTLSAAVALHQAVGHGEHTREEDAATLPRIIQGVADDKAVVDREQTAFVENTAARNRRAWIQLAVPINPAAVDDHQLCRQGVENTGPKAARSASTDRVAVNSAVVQNQPAAGDTVVEAGTFSFQVADILLVAAVFKDAAVLHNYLATYIVDATSSRGRIVVIDTAPIGDGQPPFVVDPSPLPYAAVVGRRLVAAHLS